MYEHLKDMFDHLSTIYKHHKVNDVLVYKIYYFVKLNEQTKVKMVLINFMSIQSWNYAFTLL